MRTAEQRKYFEILKRYERKFREDELTIINDAEAS